MEFFNKNTGFLQLRYTVFFLIIAILFAFPRIIMAKADFGVFTGISGTSTVIFIADSLFDMKGSLVDDAADNGLLTGELGIGMGFSMNNLGLRIEGLMGYYKYHVLQQPNTAYMMYMAGAELYLTTRDNGTGYLLGAGYGKFNGNQWDEVLGKEVTVFKKHEGYAVWGTVGYKGDNFEINARVRYHKFTMINEVNLARYEGNDYKKFRDDYVFVLRFCYWMNFY